MSETLRVALSDATTSGGLLIALASERAEELVRLLIAGGDLGAVVGRVETGSGIDVLM